jgi:hypothetical protein
MNRLPLILSLLALVAALSGTAYAASKIDGKTIKPKTIPANRLKPHSLTAAQLAPGVLSAPQAPAAAPQHVASADTAASAQTAAHAASADVATRATTAANAEALSGHVAGCPAGTAPAAGECLETAPSASTVTAPAAASACAAKGGQLPDALTLAAVGADLAEGGEWTAQIPQVAGPGTYAVVTVASGGVIESAVSSSTLPYRCALPLVR